MTTKKIAKPARKKPKTSETEAQKRAARFVDEPGRDNLVPKKK